MTLLSKRSLFKRKSFEALFKTSFGIRVNLFSWFCTKAEDFNFSELKSKNPKCFLKNNSREFHPCLGWTTSQAISWHHQQKLECLKNGMRQTLSPKKCSKSVLMEFCRLSRARKNTFCFTSHRVKYLYTTQIAEKRCFKLRWVTLTKCRKLKFTLRFQIYLQA